jgi:PTH1 family peptidyl-tRNA hydrolase
MAAGLARGMETSYLVVGLGNPGSEYAHTRHNAGFLVVDRLAGKWRAALNYEKKFNARITRADREGSRVLLCQPQTYMNSSGEAVAAVLQYYRVPVKGLLVTVDDADLPLGEIRMRPGGSSGGHHGLESIEQHLGTREFARQRIGIGRERGQREITGFVLGRFSSTETGQLDKVLSVACAQAECWLDAGIQKAMNQFNGVATGGESGNERKDQ